MSFFQIFTFVISLVMQMQAAKAAKARQKKAEREAKERADAAKGFQLGVEGEASVLPVAYGRNLLGGIRVFHNTKNTFVVAAPAVGGQLFQKALNASRNGIKHEFLTVQTALCYGPINACINIVVDGRLYDDDKFKAVIGAKEFLDEGRLMGGHRFHVYPKGNVADTLLTANYQLNRPFTNTAYVTAVYALNRDDYQYNGVPDVKFIVEGLLVKDILFSQGQYILSTTKSYSNNPALCLLDYLMSPIYGRGLTIDEVDIESFYYAKGICDRVVLSNLATEGIYWKAKGISRDVKLYECNVTLSPTTTVRDNIEIILETMGQAELIWTAGKYKLILEYPELFEDKAVFKKGDVIQYDFDLYRAKIDVNKPANNFLAFMTNATYWTRDVISGYITDDDIIRGAENTVTWPNASERYNFVTVRFLNESKDFVEDSVSWPPKTGSIPGPALYRGVWSPTAVYGKSDIVDYRVNDLSPYVKYQFNDAAIYSGEYRSDVLYVVNERVTYLNEQYRLTGEAPIGTLPTNTTYWTKLLNLNTLVPSAGSGWIIYDVFDVYNTFRSEDNGLPLEADFFEAGITDYYHALAKAEQRVRFSRTSTSFKLVLSLEYSKLEPGDLIRVRSEVLRIYDEIMRLENVKILDNGNAEIDATKFDARQLAWNADDTEIVEPRITFDTKIPQCTNLVFTKTNLTSTLSSGRLSWTAPNDIRVVKFQVFYTTSALSSITDTTVWNLIGETRNNFLEIPSLNTADYVLTVVSVAANGSTSPRRELLSEWPLIGVGLSAISVDNTLLLNVTVYTRSSTIPATPIGGIFDFSVMALTTLPRDPNNSGGGSLASVFMIDAVDALVIENSDLLLLNEGSGTVSNVINYSNLKTNALDELLIRTGDALKVNLIETITQEANTNVNNTVSTTPITTTVITFNNLKVNALDELLIRVGDKLKINPLENVTTVVTNAPAQAGIVWYATPPIGSGTLYASTAVAESNSKAIPDTTLNWTQPYAISDSLVTVTASRTTLGVGTDANGNLNVFSEAFGNIIVKVDDTDFSNTADVTYSTKDIVKCSVAPMTNTLNSDRSRYSVVGLVGSQGRFTVVAVFRGRTYEFIINVQAVQDAYIVDITPPPTPSNIGVTVGVSTVFIKLNIQPLYSVGHGHRLTRVYGAVGLNKVFTDASIMYEFTGTFGAMPRNINETVSLWFKYVSVDGIESTLPFGGTNGLNATTLQLGPNDIAANAITAESLQVVSLDALTANMGQLNAGSINLTNNAGAIYAGKTSFADGNNGFYLGNDKVGSTNNYTFSIGNTLNYFKYDGYSTQFSGAIFASSGTFAGALQAATGTFSGELYAATGTFGGNLMAGVLDISELESERYEYFTPGPRAIIVPIGKTSMRVTLVGASGGGGGGSTGGGYPVPGGGGGGSTGAVVATYEGLVAGTTYTLIVGAKGVGGTTGINTNGTNGTDGGDTSIVGLVASVGGKGGTAGNINSPLNGTVGGGVGGLAGSNGNNGSNGTRSTLTNNRFGGVNPAGDGAIGLGGIAGINGRKGGNGGGATIRSVPPAQDGVDGFAYIEFFNPNSVVTKNEYNTLISRLQTQLGYIP